MRPTLYTRCRLRELAFRQDKQDCQGVVPLYQGKKLMPGERGRKKSTM